MDKQAIYFNVITKGLGYVNDARVVKLEGGHSFRAVRMSLIEGRVDNPRYVYIDLTVKGEATVDLIRQHRDAIADENRKVLAAVDISSLRTTAFVYKNGERKGQPGAALKGALIGISYLSIDGEVVYTRPEQETESAPAPEVPEPEQAEAA